MSIYKKTTIAAAVASAVIGAAALTPANAAVVLCTGANCVDTDANVLVNAGTAPVITGNYNNSDIDVTFTSTTDATLVGGANGQASVGSLDNLLNQLTFTIENGFGFTAALFNLAPVPGNAANEAISIFVNYMNADGSIGQIQQSIGTNGQNFIGLSGTNGEIFTSAGFTADPSTNGIGEFRQLRLGGVAAIGAVPEPAAWVMMLLGMAAVGYTMRRKDKAGLRVRFA
ncbi:PEPxxWA-CTERM sorting domain-containing protein [Sphingorhabdus sp.]|uniref:PEPxxWA-CTERM sorting domain-containing protein n=1 Tax=Sphingorhabdus sp. TaxID=1902408 RepID=UPI00391DACC4